MFKKRFSFPTLSILVLSLFLIAGCSDSGNSDGADKFIRSTNFGSVSGIAYTNNTIAWLGIPYAKPPTATNGLRWKVPQYPDSWDGILPSLKSPSECEPCSQMGAHPITWETTGPIGSEDCLMLGIWRPNNNETNLPVYFWIHGGSNNYGGLFQIDGSVIASRSNMVVVAIQYRLGPFGWISHPSLRTGGAGNEENDSGDFGTMDTIKALEWVRDNIESFGGDPSNILIAGESAGAHNVMNLILSPLATGLFHKALHQSEGMRLRTVAAGESDAKKFISNLLAIDGLTEVPGGDTKAYLEGKTAENIVEGYWHNEPPSSSAFRDGYVIPDDTTVGTIESGVYNKVPIILGCNMDEMKFYLPLQGPAVKNAYLTPDYGVKVPIPSGPYTWMDLFKVLIPDLVSDSALVTKDSVTLDDVIPTQTDRDLYTASNYIGTLNSKVKSVDDFARAFKGQANQHVYAYLLKWDGADGSDYQFALGAAHATDLPFFFGLDTDIYGGAAFSPSNDTVGRQALSAAIMKYVDNFVRAGDPNGTDLPQWDEWSNIPDEPKMIEWDSTETAIDIKMSTAEYTAADVENLFWILYFDLPASSRNILFWFYTPKTIN